MNPVIPWRDLAGVVDVVVAWTCFGGEARSLAELACHSDTYTPMSEHTWRPFPEALVKGGVEKALDAGNKAIKAEQDAEDRAREALEEAVGSGAAGRRKQLGPLLAPKSSQGKKQ